MTIYVTGSNGYVGHMLQTLFAESQMDFQSCGRSNRNSIYFSLQELFDIDIPPHSVVIHAAFDFSLRAQRNSLNVISLLNLVEYCKAREIKLILVSSSSAAFPHRSNYASVKQLQESVLRTHNYGTVLRIGIIVANDNNFMRLIKKSVSTCILFRGRDDSRLFPFTNLLPLSNLFLDVVKSNRELKFKLIEAYDLNQDLVSFLELQNLMKSQPFCNFALYVSLLPVLVILWPFRFNARVNRIFNSIKFVY